MCGGRRAGWCRLTPRSHQQLQGTRMNELQMKNSFDANAVESVINPSYFLKMSLFLNLLRLPEQRPFYLLFFCIYLDKIRVWLSRTDWILNHGLRRLRVCRHARMTRGPIVGVTPVATGPWVRWIATSVAVGWVAIPGPLVSVAAVRWIAMCRICWNESKEAWVDSLCWRNEWINVHEKKMHQFRHNEKGELTLCWAGGSINRHHAGVFSSHLQNDKTAGMLRSRKTRFLVCVEPDAMWVREEHSEPVSGGQALQTTTLTLGG